MWGCVGFDEAEGDERWGEEEEPGEGYEAGAVAV